MKLHPREVQIYAFNNRQSNDEMPIIGECNQMLFVASLFFANFQYSCRVIAKFKVLECWAMNLKQSHGFKIVWR